MKKKFIIAPLIALTAAFTLQSYQSGTHNLMGNRTGSNGSSNGCASCHNGQSSATSVSIVVKQNGTEVSTYTPGQTYQVTLSGTNSNANPKFGFQLTCGSTTTSGTMYGTFSNTGVTGTSLRLSGQLVEHSVGIAGTVSNGTATYSLTFDWTAPVAGSGDVKFFSVINAVNGNNMDGSGDNWNLGTSGVIKEAVTTGIKSNIEKSSIAVYPNPVKSTLSISNFANSAKEVKVQIMNVVGQTVMSTTTKNNNEKINVNVAQLTAGHYTVLINDGTTTYSQKFVKE